MYYEDGTFIYIKMKLYWLWFSITAVFWFGHFIDVTTIYVFSTADTLKIIKIDVGPMFSIWLGCFNVLMITFRLIDIFFHDAKKKYIVYYKNNAFWAFVGPLFPRN